MKRPIAPLALVALLFASACRTPVQVHELPEERTASGLSFRDLRAGDGAEATAGSRVTVHYIGRFADGATFDSSYDRGASLTFTIGAGEVIPGWEEGMIGMRTGGLRRILIPPELGFTGEGAAAGRALDLEVELLEVAPR